MKKIIFMLTLMSFIFNANFCSAGIVRIYDFGLNDFTNFYNQLTNHMNEQTKNKYPISMNQRPFKNISLSNDNYTVYSFTIGKNSGEVVTVHTFLDKSGYVHHFNIFCNAKNERRRAILGAPLNIIITGTGFTDADSLSFYFNSTERALKNGIIKHHEKFFIDSKNRYLNINYTCLNRDTKDYLFEIYATNS